MQSLPAPPVRSSLRHGFRLWLSACTLSPSPSNPNLITRALIRVARGNDIPVYSLAPGARIWDVRQGAKAQRFYQSVSERESFLGVRLVKDKVLTDHIIHRLGLPGVEFGIAETIEMAKNIARRLGYPVVVKPSDRDKAVGITLAIESETDLDAAFARAKGELRYKGVVMIERHYRGDHHRLSVFGGTFKRATQIRAAHVIADGRRTVEELIAAENATRTTGEVEAGFLIRLVVDLEMIDYLARQGYSLADRPPSGTKLQLRKTSNIATGGNLPDVSAHIHPDNIAMAETIARNFWLDGVGIDFVTPDISVSWRDIPCAVVDVNSPPGITGMIFLLKGRSATNSPPARMAASPACSSSRETMRCKPRSQSASPPMV